MFRNWRHLTTLRTTQQTPYAQAQATADVVNFALGQPSPCLLTAASEQLRSAAVAKLGATADPFALQYGAGQGSAPFRAALAAFLTRQHGGTPVLPSELFITNGNSSALDMLCGVVLGAGARAGEPPVVLAEQPTYFLAGAVLRDHGAVVRPLHMTRGGVDVAELRAGAAGATMAYLQANFHNPTGCSLSAGNRAAVRAAAVESGIVVVSDEPYNLLRFGADLQPAAPSLAGGEQRKEAVAAAAAETAGAAQAVGSAPALRGQVLALGSFSKVLAPGLRLGWIQAPAAAIAALQAVGHLRSGGGASPMTCSLVQHLCETEELDASLLRVRQVLDARCAALCAALETLLAPLGFKIEARPLGGYFVWLRLPPSVNAQQFETVAAACGVVFTAGHRCSAAEDSASDGLDRYIRLSFAFYAEDELLLGVQRLRDAANILFETKS